MIQYKLQAIILLFLLLTVNGHGYIPRAHLIIEKTASNHGSGAYQVIQEVHIPLEQDLLIAREYWTIVDGETMYVYIEGLKGWKDNLRLAILYKDGQRYWINENGTVEKTILTKDFFEPFFHFRSAKGLAKILIEKRMAPRNILAEQPAPRNLTNLQYEPQSFIKLTRFNRLVAYAIGSSAIDDNANPPQPGLWVEQDNFNVLRVRLPSLADISAQDYTLFPGTLYLPKTRVLRWDNNHANIQLVKVAHLGRNSRSAHDKTQAGYLRELSQKRKITARIPDNARVREFFSRFR